MRIMKSAVVALFVCAVLGFPFAVAAATMQTGHVVLSDTHIKTDVEHKLSELELAPAQVKVSVQDGVVTLSGSAACRASG